MQHRPAKRTTCLPTVRILIGSRDIQALYDDRRAYKTVEDRWASRRLVLNISKPSKRNSDPRGSLDHLDIALRGLFRCYSVAEIEIKLKSWCKKRPSANTVCKYCLRVSSNDSK